MRIYKAYNLLIASELHFPELIEAEGIPDVTIIFSKDNSADEIQHNGGNNCRGKIPGVGEFLIQEGQKITIFPAPNTEEDLLRITILGTAMCMLLRQRGLLVIHASCIRIKDKAVAFMGGSGWGKSTIALTFHTKGYNVLTDDVLPIEVTDDSVMVYPAYSQFKLFPQALTSLEQDTEGLSKVSQKSHKLTYKFTKGFQQDSLQLNTIYVLRKGNKHEITNIKSRDAFLELVQHTRAMNIMTNDNSMTNHMQLCSKLIKQVKFSYFTRKPALEDLPKLVQMIVDDLSEDI